VWIGLGRRGGWVKDYRVLDKGRCLSRVQECIWRGILHLIKGENNWLCICDM